MLAPIAVKGKSKPVSVYRPADLVPKSLLWEKLQFSVMPRNKIWGRKQSMAEIEASIMNGAGLIAIEGDPGSGKTMLLDYVQTWGGKMSTRVVRSAADPLEKDDPLKIWKAIFFQLFGLHRIGLGKTKGQQRDKVLSQLEPDKVSQGIQTLL